MNEIDADTKSYLNLVVKSFSPGIRYACAYGSGVFKQSGHKSVKDNMIDLIFVVNNAFTWHQSNMDKYNDHYSFLKHFSPNFIATIQRNYGASIFYNTRIDFEGRLIKYGVIEERDFLLDLQNWETLYCAGRLHKPVFSLKGIDNPNINRAIQANLKSAVVTSLLTLPEKFLEEELYLKIAGMSYAGDLRMIVGEDKNKVMNIVKPNIEKFQSLYNEILCASNSISLNNGKIEQDLDSTVQKSYLNSLPTRLRNNIFKQHGINVNMPSQKFQTSLEKIVENRSVCKKSAMKGVASIVRRSSTTQTFKSIFSAGASKSVVYGAEKLLKMVKSFVK